MRTEKELWEIVLSRQDLFTAGLCCWTTTLWLHGLITADEDNYIDYVLNKHLPARIPNSAYCWSYDEIAPRIEWIKNRIKQI